MNLSRTLEHLRALVAFETTNPPREIPADGGVIAYAADRLEATGFALDIQDLGDGCVTLLATRGDPTHLINVHLDTVPADPGYTGDPWTLRVDDEKATGLGACDIKGAAACLLTAAEHTSGPAAILFTTDEEAGSSRCVRDFCARMPLALDAVVVAEPTGGRAVTGHRGIRTFTGHFHGVAGHSSGPRALEDNALHRASRWIAAALQLAEGHREELRFEELHGSCFNVGVVEGGRKPNVVAPSARLRFGLRPLPGQDADQLARLYLDLADSSEVTWEEGFTGPPLPATGGPDGQAALQAARDFADRYGLPPASPVDFWTEAALFSQAGLPTLVLGPGHISQAHTADESVPLDDLERVAALYAALLA